MTPGELSGTVNIESWPLREPLQIKGYVFPNADVVTVTLSDGIHQGRGEAAGVYYRGETPEQMCRDIEAELASPGPLDRTTLASRLAPGGARNALDCALWDLAARQAGQPVWRLAGLAPPRPLRTTLTFGVSSVAATARAVAGARSAKALKLKLAGDEDDARRILAVRAERPDVWLAVDANQALDLAGLLELAGPLVDAGVAMVEQPLPIGEDYRLAGLDFPIPLAADESIQSSAYLSGLHGLYQVINIKLDKCGGLTEGLAMARVARNLGFKVMVGGMACTSLGLAPGFVLGQVCDIADLDAPTFLRTDRTPCAVYADGDVTCGPEVWGGG
jgi:L-Ala-D/L-Glu epimerase